MDCGDMCLHVNAAWTTAVVVDVWPSDGNLRMDERMRGTVVTALSRIHARGETGFQTASASTTVTALTL
jgi:hypothetical protein